MMPNIDDWPSITPEKRLKGDNNFNQHSSNIKHTHTHTHPGAYAHVYICNRGYETEEVQKKFPG